MIPPDLLDYSKKHIEFLRDLHALGVTLKKYQNVDRYLAWLRLIDRQEHHSEQNFLIPPPDVAWLWHCHRLAPAAYERYTIATFGRILEPNPPFSFQVKDTTDICALKTRELWREMFPEFSFFDIDCKPEGALPVTQISDAGLVGKFDLLGSTERQATFLFQVSDPRFEDDEFLIEGIDRYHKFLSLHNADGRPIVPTYQIDLMWHTHMLVSTSQYNKDCCEIRGTRLDHDDSLNDRTPGGTLEHAYKATRKSWLQAYGEEYRVPHGMYRGEPPADFYGKEWTPHETPVSRESSILECGSTSSGNTPWVPATETAMTSKGEPAFISMRSEIRAAKGKLDIPQRDGYVFGRKNPSSDRQIGYFSLETREAYSILYRRLKKQCQLKQAKCNAFLCDVTPCHCCGQKMSPSQLDRYEEMQRDLKSCTEMLNAVLQVLNRSTIPFHSKSGVYAGESTSMNVDTHDSTSCTHISSAGGSDSARNAAIYGNITLADLCNAGGCGAVPGGDSGGGCAGGGCG